MSRHRHIHHIKNGVSLRSVVDKEYNNSTILTKALELDKIYWKQWITQKVNIFKITYKKSWAALLTKHNNNEEIASKELYDNLKLVSLKLFKNKIEEVEKRNKLRIQKIKENKSKTSVDMINYYDLKNYDFSKHMQNILDPSEMETYNKKFMEIFHNEKPLIKINDTNKDSEPYIYFIITEEPDYWTDKLDEYDLKIERLQPYFNSFKSVSNIKEFLIRLGFIQTFDNNDYDLSDSKNRKHISFIYYNDNFRVSTYFKTFAYLKNKFDKTSLRCIGYKNLLYLNLEKNYPREISDFIARSIIIDNNNKTETLTKEYLKIHIIDKYTENGYVFDDTITAEEIYIVRPVEYIGDIRYTAAVGSNIYILNFKNSDDDTLKKNLAEIKKLLETTYYTFIVSKFINTKKINNRIFHIRCNINSSITIFPKPETLTPDTSQKYIMKAFINKKNPIRMSDTSSENDSPKSYNNINTHSIGEYQIFPDDIPTEIISQELHAHYLSQISDITHKVFSVLKNEVQLYPDCHSAFQEFGFDFMIGENDKVYLAEVNVDGGFYYFQDNKEIYQNKYMILNNQDSIIHGILTPLFVNKKYDIIKPEYNTFIQVNITDDLALEKDRKGKRIYAPLKQRGPEPYRNRKTYLNNLRRRITSTKRGQTNTHTRTQTHRQTLLSGK